MKKLLALMTGLAVSAGVLSDNQEPELAPSWYTNFTNGPESDRLCFVASGSGENEEAAEAFASFMMLKNIAKTVAAEISQVKFSQENGIEGSKKFNSLRSAFFARKLNGGKIVKKEFEKRDDQVIVFMMVEFRDGHCEGK